MKKKIESKDEENDSDWYNELDDKLVTVDVDRQLKTDGKFVILLCCAKNALR